MARRPRRQSDQESSTSTVRRARFGCIAIATSFASGVGILAVIALLGSHPPTAALCEILMLEDQQPAWPHIFLKLVPEAERIALNSADLGEYATLADSIRNELESVLEEEDSSSPLRGLRFLETDHPGILVAHKFGFIDRGNVAGHALMNLGQDVDGSQVIVFTRDGIYWSNRASIANRFLNGDPIEQIELSLAEGRGWASRWGSAIPRLAPPTSDPERDPQSKSGDFLELLRGNR